MYLNLLQSLSRKIEFYFSEIEAVHNFEYGPEFEIALCKILKDLLPNRFGVCRGYIITGEGKQVGDDIIVYDRLSFPTIRMLGEENFSQREQVPIEAVYCYIEAKHNLELDPKQDNPKKDGTLQTALRQIDNVRLLQRSKRPWEKINDAVSLGAPFKVKIPDGWPQISNPLLACIISRKTSLKYDWPEKNLSKGDLPSSDAWKILASVQNPMHADLIVAGDRVIALPTFTKVQKESKIATFLDPNCKLHVFKTTSNALAVGLCQILWALSRVQLNPMPWENVIVSGFDSPLEPS